MNCIAKVSPNTFFFAVGAAFDFHSGAKKRAPRILQKTGLEWIHRLGQEPGRLLGRYAKGNFQFLRRSLGDLLHDH